MIDNRGQNPCRSAADSRREFVKRNLAMMGAAAAAAALARIEPAKAHCGWRHHHHPYDPFDLGPNCFLRGTSISTAEGERRIEEIGVGDLVPTVFGGARPIVRIARYRRTKSVGTKAWPLDARPIRIARSAFAPDFPRADLFVTSGHALLIDGALVPAGDLVNGATITRFSAEGLDELEFFHLELETHDAIYAEGLPCETMREVPRAAGSFLKRAPWSDGLRSPASICAPILSYGGARGAVLSRLRSAMSPWIDRRRTLDLIRDCLEERGVAMCRGALAPSR